MNILIYSDLHLEFASFDPPQLPVDLVVLAGDIGRGEKAVKWVNEAFNCKVVYVAGNHEYYGGSLERTWDKMKKAAQPHVHLLENESFVYKGVRFLGSTCWTDFTSTGDLKSAAYDASESMNDFKKIRVGERYRRLRPEDVRTKNHIAYEWLSRELSAEFAGKTIVVSHHAPLLATLDFKHKGHLGAAYANHWPELVSLADMWVFGHTHWPMNTQMLGCRLISNPKGYPSEPTDFNPGFLIEF